jgi:hypothetical protein
LFVDSRKIENIDKLPIWTCFNTYSLSLEDKKISIKYFYHGFFEKWLLLKVKKLGISTTIKYADKNMFQSE